jgi:uncharacterized protein
LILLIRAVPRGGKTGFKKKMDDGSYKVAVNAPAEGGMANRELVRWLGVEFGVSRDSVSVISGASSRIKRVRIDAPSAIPEWYDD